MWFPSFVKRVRLPALMLGLLVLNGCAGLKSVPEPSVQAEVSAHLQDRHRQALAAMEQGDQGLAQTIWQEMINLQPTLVVPYVNLGLLAERQGDKDSAKAWYEKALTADATQPEALNQLGVLYREDGQFEKALDYYRRALAANDQLPQVHYNLGILYDLYLADYQQAITHYEQYQTLRDGKDEDVARWIIDLKRRAQ